MGASRRTKTARTASFSLVLAQFLALGLLLVACQRGQNPKETKPSEGLPSREEGAESRRRQSQEQELTRLLDEAEDLFNRGENDLGCERVERADALSQSLAKAPTNQQKSFQAACSAQ
ncbi:hypothetical protein [Vulcanococcus sp.]|jgi:hypothetical protein|uniref:hypothetical protein n=1 Tax=Vulcanococcus sp. TaxID=2856995 RepID=UPI00323489D0